MLSRSLFVLLLPALLVMACGQPRAVAVSPAASATPTWTARWERDAGDGVTHAINLREDGRFGFHAWAELPVSRAMGRWQRDGDRITLTVEATGSDEQTFPYPGVWTAAQLGEGKLTVSAGATQLSWRNVGPADDLGLWFVTPPDGAALLKGTVSVIGSEQPPLDVLAIYYVANGHPYVVMDTVAGDRLTLYEAPSTDRLMLSVPPSFVTAVGVAGALAEEKYGSYIPLTDIDVKPTPAEGLRAVPLMALKVAGVPIAKMSGAGSSRGDLPKDALVRLDIDLTLTKRDGMDKRAPGLVNLVP